MLIFTFCLCIYIIFKCFLVKKHSFFKLCEYCGVPCLLGHTRVETEYTRFDHFWHSFANFALGIDTQIYVFLVFSIRSVQTALINGHHNMISKRFLIRNGKSAPLLASLSMIFSLKYIHTENHSIAQQNSYYNSYDNIFKSGSEWHSQYDIVISAASIIILFYWYSSLWHDKATSNHSYRE